MPMPPDKRKGPAVGEPGASQNTSSEVNIGRYYNTPPINAVQERNIIPFPGARTEPAMAEACQALWRDYVNKTQVAEIAGQRFQCAFQSLSVRKGGAS